MADPNIPIDPTTGLPFAPTADQITLLNQYTDAVANYRNVESGLDTILDKVSESWDTLNQRMQAAGTSLDTLGALNDQQVTQLGLVASGVFKAREAFTGLAGIDFGNLSTFKETISDIRDALFSGGTAASDFVGIIGSLTKALSGAGVPQQAINTAWQKGTSAVLDLASSIITHADNLTRAQSAYVQMAASTGQLSDLWNAAGKDLQNLNTIMETQTQMIGDTIEATGLSAKQVEAYYAELGQVPGALNSIVSTTDKTGESTSMLTAAIQVATGTGRKYSDVIDDLKLAFKDYGLVGEDALKFSVRMSEVSTKLKAPLEDVKRALQGSAEAFKMFASSQQAASTTSEGLSKILNTYGKALESTGLSASQSIRVVGELTNQMANLSIAQKSYISQQTGGAGGLQGGFQIEKRLMSGDTEGVFNDVIKTIQQQFGKIVNIDEASQSQAAASQLEKQSLMLTQGPLGSLVKDQQTAIKVLQAFRNKQEGKADTITTALSPSAVQDAADKGLEFEKGSYSELTKIRSHIERMRYVADQGVGRGVQEALTARTTPGATEAEGAVKGSLSEYIKSQRAAGGTQVATTAYGLATGNVENRTGLDAARTVQNALASIKEVPLSFKAAFDTLKKAVSSGDTDVIEAQRKDLEARKTAANDMVQVTKDGTEQHRRALSERNTASKLLTAVSPIQETSPPATSNAPIKETPKSADRPPTTSAVPKVFDADTPVPPQSAKPTGVPTRTAGQQVGEAAAGTAAFHPLPAGEQVRAAATASAARPNTGVTSAQPGTAAATAASAPGGREMTVKLEGKFSIDCPHCGRPHNVSSQALLTPSQFSVPH